MFYVYVLKSKKTDKLYIGFTDKVFERIKKHNTGQVTSTKAFIPYELVYFEGYWSKADAIKREANLKYFGQAYRRLKERMSNSLQGAL